MGVLLLILAGGLSFLAGSSGSPLTWTPIAWVMLMITSASSDGKYVLVAVVMGICYVAGLTINKDIIGD
jgi:hypothetical protein